MKSRILSRRKFLNVLSKDIFAGLVGISFIGSPHAVSFSSENFDLSVAKNGEFSSQFEAGYNRIKKGVDVFGGMRSIVKGRKAILKVNALDNRNQLGNTSSEAVGAVIKLCREAGSKSVTVVSNDRGLNTPSKNHPTLKETIIAQEGEFLILTNNKQQYIKQPLDKGEWHNLHVAKILYEPDTVLINLPRAKTHPWTCYTMCIKKLMGLTLNMNHFHSGGKAKWPDFPLRMAAAFKHIF